MKRIACGFAVCFAVISALAGEIPATSEGDWVARAFRFHTGEVLPELRIHYTRFGAPTGEPVLIPHGTTQSGANYDDMVDAQYRLVTEHLGIRHLRLILGYSMGGIETWILEREIKRVKRGSLLLIPASDQTAGHGTVFQARFWKTEVDGLLRSAPHGPK